MTETTHLDVDALDAARAAAAAGPWEPDADMPWEVVTGERQPVANCLDEADAALIIAAVNALPELLAEIREGRALREVVEGLAKDLHTDARSMWTSAETHKSETDEVVGDTYYEVSKRLRAVLAAVDGSHPVPPTSG